MRNEKGIQRSREKKINTVKKTEKVLKGSEEIPKDMKKIE